MRSSTKFFSLLSLLVALLATTPVASASNYTRGVTDNPRLARSEINGLKALIDNLYSTAALAGLWETNTIHASDRSLLQGVQFSSEIQMSTLQDWLQNWYGITYEPRLRPGTMQQIRSLSKLSEDTFERRFLLAMVRQHKKTTLLAQRLIELNGTIDLYLYAPNIVNTAKQASARWTNALCTWYGACPKVVPVP